MRSIREIKDFLSMTEGENILRRYFVMNGFDGALTALGIILGSFIVTVGSEPDLEKIKILISTGIGASIAMGVSGFWIAYLTEKAERTKERKELEEKMVTDLNNTRITRANFWTSLVIAAVDGISPFIFSVLALLPIFFVFVGLPVMAAYGISFGVILIEVIVLGVFLGAVSKENKLIYALKIIPAALLVAGLTYLLELFL
ncbi:MAG: hypothetical protein HeimAB125_16390 [Candidatus Heimdallarchaeota archaeon AB_125]|nr:MAG: hypothetical protein HeimAB125_16390 [Candidatus Heimdallarchaeota archaeon AB_125]